MRIAELANHQTVERTLHFFKREVSLFECVLIPLAVLGFRVTETSGF